MYHKSKKIKMKVWKFVEIKYFNSLQSLPFDSLQN